MNEIERHIKLLGVEAQDKVTLIKGIVSCISFDLYGCIQASITPKKKKEEESFWVDVTRLKVLTNKRVMKLPEFERGYVAEGKKGCSYKPKRGHI